MNDKLASSITGVNNLPVTPAVAVRLIATRRIQFPLSSEERVGVRPGVQLIFRPAPKQSFNRRLP
jgi:hypothetical protein